MPKKKQYHFVLTVQQHRGPGRVEQATMDGTFMWSGTREDAYNAKIAEARSLGGFTEGETIVTLFWSLEENRL